MSDRQAQLSGEVDAIILDMDGTLLDTERLYKSCTLQALESLGWPDQQPLIAKMVGLSSAKCDVLLQTELGAAFPLEAYHAAFEVCRTARINEGIPLKTGTLALLDALAAANFPMAIATSSSRESAERHLRVAGIRDRFETLVTSDDVIEAKPNPEIYLIAARLLGVSPERAIAIEDSGHGVRAAYAAGLITIMVPDMVLPDDDIRAMCAVVCGDLYQALELLAAHIPSLSTKQSSATTLL